MPELTLMDHCELWLKDQNKPIYPRCTNQALRDYEKWVEYAFIKSWDD